MSPRNRWARTLAALAAAAITMQASAAYITGAFEVDGSFLPMQDGSTALSTLLNANAIDFTDPVAPATATPGTAGIIEVTATSGDFISLLPIATTGTIQDLSFQNGPFTNFPTPPITSFQQFPPVTIDLTSIAVVTQTDVFLHLLGNTTIHAANFQSTAGTFELTGRNVGTNASTSFAFAAVNAVPEPTILGLIGLGLLALTVARRPWGSRRRR
jgi:hypothetical protein